MGYNPIKDHGGNNGVFLDNYYRLHYADGASLVDNVPKELMEVVDPHWAQFPPQHPFVAHFGGLCYIVLTFLSVFGNGLVIYMFLKGLPVGLGIFLHPVWPWGVFGLTGTRITAGKAAIVLILLWAYVIGISIPPFFGWGGYAMEGVLVTCSYDYLKDDWNRKSFMLYAFIVNYCIPLTFITYYYSQIARAVISHEKELRAQAKKMNVKTLRSAGNSDENAEFKIAKVAITNVILWFMIWTPYAAVAMTAQFGNRQLITPLVSQIPSFVAKTASVLNPVIFALSHPKYREALANEVPCLGLGDKPKPSDTDTKQETA